MASTDRKIIATSYERYNGGARIKRQYGSSTVTRFYVFYVEDDKDPSKWKKVEGFGKTPGERKTDAIRRSGLVGTLQGPPRATPGQKQRKQAAEAAKNGPGFYVVNRGTGGDRLAVNHGPFSSLEEAQESAWSDLAQFNSMRLNYLLPVMIVKASSRTDAANILGPSADRVYWINGKTKGAPPDPRQVSFAGFARGTTKWRDYTGKPARPKKRKRDR